MKPNTALLISKDVPILLQPSGDAADETLTHPGCLRELTLRKGLCRVHEEPTNDARALWREYVGGSTSCGESIGASIDDHADSRPNDMGVAAEVEPRHTHSLARLLASLGHERDGHERDGLPTKLLSRTKQVPPVVRDGSRRARAHVLHQERVPCCGCREIHAVIGANRAGWPDDHVLLWQGQKLGQDGRDLRGSELVSAAGSHLY